MHGMQVTLTACAVSAETGLAVARVTTGSVDALQTRRTSRGRVAFIIIYTAQVSLSTPEFCRHTHTHARNYAIHPFQLHRY